MKKQIVLLCTPHSPGTVLALNVRDDCGLFLEDDDGY